MPQIYLASYPTTPRFVLVDDQPAVIATVNRLPQEAVAKNAARYLFNNGALLGARSTATA